MLLSMLLSLERQEQVLLSMLLLLERQEQVLLSVLLSLERQEQVLLPVLLSMLLLVLLSVLLSLSMDLFQNGCCTVPCRGTFTVLFLVNQKSPHFGGVPPPPSRLHQARAGPWPRVGRAEVQ